MKTKAWILAALALGAVPAPTHAQIEIDSATVSGIEARALGPAVMGGRIAALDAVPQDPLIVYVGAAGGGLWKSSDGAVTFQPVFDDHIQSIGAVRVDPSDPETVWVGTGESWTRNSVSVGDGVYRSTDGGETWTHQGLADSERIAKIEVDPRSSDTVLVCATGHLWNANEERGVYKTTDGGDTWRRVLYVDTDTGCSDLTFDPQAPDILYAGMWQFRRSPDFFTSGGPGSGLYKSTDGGETWVELTEGLPDSDKGRIAVAVAPSRPSVVYAVVEAKAGGLFRSDDLGGTWTRVNSSFTVTGRPFYFALLRVDPESFDRVYKPGFSFGVSHDGGRSFTSPFTGFGGGVHSDHHALWIDPRNPQRLLLGTDGGVYTSEDRGLHWRFLQALPVSQFYRVGVDLDFPYNVFGGLQDNGTWRGPSRSLGGIENRDWQNLYGGDGFWALADPTDRDQMYVEYQGGELRRVRLSTGAARDIKPFAEEGQPELRFNWNTPIHLSRSEPGTLYVGAQKLLRSRDQGESWEAISPDLTTNDPEKQRQRESGGLTRDNSSAENHTTIYTISTSPLDPGEIWVGTDDGHLQLTRDGGVTWKELAAGISGLPPGTWVSSVEASSHRPGAAFATFDGHRTGDMATYAYRTEDFGATWEALEGESIEGYAHVLKEDPVNPDLLFLGTEKGLYLSLDRGRNWARFEGNLPKVAVRDLLVHPREHDLVVATHGRGIYILDDLTPLRHLTQKVLDSTVALLPSRPSVQLIQASLQQFTGDGEYVGLNPPEAAAIAYYQKKRHLFGDLKLEIYDRDGELISTLSGSKRRGLNRVHWPMRLPPPKLPAATTLVPAFTGPRVPEGRYTVKLIKGKETLLGEVELVGDPRSPHSPEDRALQQETALDLYRMLSRLTYLVDALIDVRDQALARTEGLKERDRMRRDLEAAGEELEILRTRWVASGEGGMLSGEAQLREKLGALYGSVNGYDGRPTRSQLDRLETLRGQLEDAFESFEAFTSERLADLNQGLARRGLEEIEVLTQEEWEAKQP